VRKAWEQLLGAIQQLLDALVVHDLSAVNLGSEHESFCVYQQMSLTAFDLLAAVVAAFFSTYAGLFTD